MPNTVETTRDTPALPAHRFPSVLLSALACILILCACIGAGAYLYVSATHLVSEYRRHLNSSADQAQLFFDQREVLLRAIAATAVPLKELAALPPTSTLRPLSTPATDQNNLYQLLLTQRHWNAINRNGTLICSQLNPTLTYSLVTVGNAVSWQLQQPALALQLKSMNADLHRRQTSVIWLRPTDNNNARLVAFTPLDRSNQEGGWLGMEFSNIDRALTLTPPPANTVYSLLDARLQTVLYSSAPLNPADTHMLSEDYFGFDEGWFPQHLILSKSIGTGGLRVLYTMPTRNLLRDGQTTLLTTFVTFALFTAMVLVGTYSIRRRLLLPARQQQQTLLDSVSLNQKLIAMAPVGLALVNADGSIIFQENKQARDWMNADTLWRSRLPKDGEHSARGDVLLEDGRSLRVNAITLTYRGKLAALCSVIDVTTEHAEAASLRQAQHLAERANLAKTQFLTTMSHEIRTPLYGILGTLELISLSEPHLQHSPYMDILRRSAETLFRVVGESLDLSRIEAGHVTLEHREFCPQDLVDEVMTAFSAAAHKKALLLYTTSPVQALTPVVGDPVKISQILNNLVSNAIKFTLSGHVVLRLYCTLENDHQIMLRFQVADSGQGISPEALPKLFQPYFSHHDGTINQAGTGLGLAICQRLANLMGGTLSVVSEQGLGTSISFEITLPLARSMSTTTTSPTALRLAFQPVYVVGDIPEVVNTVRQWLRHWGADSSPYDGQAVTPGAVLVRSWPCSYRQPHWTGKQVITLPTGKQRPPTPSTQTIYTASTTLRDIGLAVQHVQTLDATVTTPTTSSIEHTQQRHLLIVDDNLINRQILKEQLTILGCSTHLEASAEAALDIPQLERFDLILTDLFLPAMDGYAFTRLLRQRGYRGPIIGITANVIQDHNQEWAETGMDAMLTKPLSMAVLRQTIQKHLK